MSATETVIAPDHLPAGRSAPDTIDELQKKAMQLDALMAMFVGESGESIRSLSDLVQGNVMWLASDLARDISTMLESIQSVVLRQGQPMQSNQ